jgi:hypothetical protein
MMRLLFGLALLVGAAGCGVIKPAMPDLPRSAIDVTPLPDSKIDVPITISLDTLFASINKEIPAEFSGSGDIGPGQYRWSMDRAPFDLIFSGTVIDFTDSARGSAAGYIRNPLNKSLSKVCDCAFGATLGFSARFALNNDYSLSAGMRLTRFDADACNLSFTRVDVTPIAKPVAAKTIGEALARLNERISRYNVRQLIQPYWARLFQPVRVGDMGYLSLNPSQVRLENLSGSAHSLTAGIGITARPVFSLTNPGPPAVIPPLPAISTQDASGFDVYVDARIQYAALNQILRTHVVNNKIAVGRNGYLLFTDAAVFGLGNDHLLMKTDFRGKQNGIGYKGHLYFTCIPRYDPVSGMLYISDLDFDTHTREKLLARSGDWILNSVIRAFFKDQLRFDVGAQINSIKDQLNASLNQPIGLKMNLAGNISSLSLVGILPENESLLMRFHATGAVSVNTVQ